MSDNRPSKRKKSGAEFRKAKRARQHEDKQLGSFMLKYFQPEDGKRKSEEKTVQEQLGRCGESEAPGIAESSVSQFEQGSGVDSLESEKDLDVIDKPEVAEQCDDSPKIEDNHEFGNDEDVESFCQIEETAEENLQEQDNDNTEEPSHCHEKQPRLREFLSNPNIVLDEVSGTFDPASLVGLKFSTEEKEKLIKMEPCQPSQSILKLRTKQFGERSRYWSQQVFFHDDGTRRKWISYSLSTDSLFAYLVFCSQAHCHGVR